MISGEALDQAEVVLSAVGELIGVDEIGQPNEHGKCRLSNRREVETVRKQAMHRFDPSHLAKNRRRRMWSIDRDLP